MEGTIPDKMNALSPSIRLILAKLAEGGHLPSISSEISFDEYKQALKKWAEKTSTSPSRRHLGHYKVLIHTPVIFADTNATDQSINDQILQIYHNITMTALRSGATLQRWCKVKTAMIEKVPGVSWIDNLRVIHLYEADYNLILKILWARKQVWNAHNHALLNDGQSGSRPGRKAIDLVIQKR